MDALEGRYLLAASVEGGLFQDANNNGAWDAAEPGVPEIRIVLSQFDENGLTVPKLFAETDAAGHYVFPSVPPGNYQITFGGQGTSAVAIPPDADNPLVVHRDYGLSSDASASAVLGTVFQDDNENAVHDPSETVGAVGRVYADTNGDGVAEYGEPYAMLDNKGRYYLPLNAGTWSIRYQIPSYFYWQTFPSANGAQAVSLNAAQTLTGVDFGANVRPGNSTISGVLYNDLNRNGVQDPDEAGMGHEYVWADMNGDGDVNYGEPQTITDNDGSYTLANITRGIYNIKHQPGAWFHASTPSAVSVNVTADLTAVADVNFGQYFYQPSGGITGTVYFDNDHDGATDASDVPASPVIVYIDSNNDGIQDPQEPRVLTEPNGTYTFPNIYPGDYTVRVGWPFDSTVADPSVSVDQSMVTAPTLYAFHAYDYVPNGAGVTGIVYQDTNGNGIRDAGEEPLAGAQVSLVDPPNSRGEVYGVSDTASDGVFDDLNVYGSHDAGYMVHLKLPDGWTQTSPRNARDIYVPLAAGQVVSNLSFGAIHAAVPTGSITGHVFADFNRDGVQDGNEWSFGGANVYLDENGNGTFDPDETRAFADANGDYAFNDIMVGTYRVAAIPPQTLMDQTASSSGTADLTVIAGGTVSRNFSFAPDGLISGTVFEDENGDGIQNATAAAAPLNSAARVLAPMNLASSAAVEAPLSGRTVYLDLNGNGKFDAGDTSTVTDATGHYQFYQIDPDQYQVRQVVPTGWSQTYPKNDAALSTDVGHGVWDTAANFGVAQVAPPPPAAPAKGTVTGTVFNDLNGDAKYNPISESGLSGRKVWVDKDKDGHIDSNEKSTTTAGDGSFSLSGLTPGSTYRFAVQVPSGWRAVTPAYVDLTLSKSQGTAGVNFGLTSSVQISGLVFNDANGDGKQKSSSSEPGLSGWSVYLDLDGNGSQNGAEPSVLTDSAGKFIFAAELAGKYKVRVAAASGWSQTTPKSNASITVSLSNGEKKSGLLFGFRRKN